MRAAAALLLLSLAACSGGEDAPEPPPSGVIPAGTYSNASSEGEAEGWRVTLTAGEASKTASIAHCAPECAAPADVPMRAGMGGLMGDYPAADGRKVTLAIRPHGDGIEVAADWGEGMESAKLVRVEQAEP